ncbi:hypothetical protein COCNU_scaffold002855G000010 [Cocos nucifera]|nr:hypothetical protein [Cocos nucifera]
MVGGSSRAANALRKKSASAKAVTSIWSTTPGESIPQPSASSSKRSLDLQGGRGAFRIQDSYDSLLQLVHHMDHFAEVIREVQRLSKEAKEKIAQAHRRMDDAQLSHLKAEEESRSLRERVKQLEFELTKAEARVLGEREIGKARAEAARVEAVKAFRASEEFCNIKMDFASLSYLQGRIDLKEKVQRIFSDLNLDLLESDNEEAEEVEDRKIQMKDVFSPTCDNLAAEDATSVPPLAIITLLDQAEVSESGALDGA